MSSVAQAVPLKAGPPFALVSSGICPTLVTQKVNIPLTSKINKWGNNLETKKLLLKLN